MFTGIISHLGRFQGFESGKQELCIAALDIAESLRVGDSLAVNGVCLSLIRKAKEGLYFNISAETGGLFDDRRAGENPPQSGH